jgi:hypothetical protein
MIGITKGIGSWKAQQHSVERFTDNAAYSSAHPDDTLVLAGPPRQGDSQQEATSGWQSLLAIGMIQGFQFGSQKPTQPLQAIGSGRSFFVSGKSQTTWRIGRLFCNGRNLLRVLYHNAVAGGLKVQNFDDKPVAQDASDLYWMNLDSEMYYVPFGLGAIFKDKIQNLIGAVYLELCMIQSYGVGFNAGQAMIMEDVNGMCDRVLPFHPTAVTGGTDQRELRTTVDEIVGFINGDNMPFSGTGLLDENLNKTSVSQ